MTLFDLPLASGDLMTTDGLRRLLAVPGIGTVAADRIARRYLTTGSLAHADVAELARLAPRVKGSDLDAVINLADAPPLPTGVRALSAFDHEWPPWATDVPAAPGVLYIRGSLPAPGSVAVVGTRNPTEFGLRVVDQVVGAAAHRGAGIVSGLAVGIDGAAHEAALQQGLPTWAILGGGVDQPSPPQNNELASRILEAGGGLLSEVPPGTSPNPQRLVARNRLQVAASAVVIAAQSGIPSGTLHTVRFAIQQHRLLAVPRPSGRWASEPQSAGNLALTDPKGCDPGVLQAKGNLALEIASRRPVADVVLHSRDDLAQVWQEDEK